MRATVERMEALRLLKIEHESVRALTDELTDEEMTRGDTIRHGLYADQQCSFKDLLAHLVCYEAYSLQAIEAWQSKTKHWVIDAMKDRRQSIKIHYGGIADRARLDLPAQLDEYQRVSRALEDKLASLSDEEWRESAFYPTRAATDLGGIIEGIMVASPRPMYRHLPVHIPNANAYIASLRQPSRRE